MNTDTDAIRKRYKGTGFNPAATIESGVRSQLARLPQWNVETKPVKWKYSIAFAVGAFVLLIVAAFLGGNNSGIAVVLLLFGIVPLILALVFAAFATSTLSPIRVAIPLLLMGGHVWFVHYYVTAATEMVIHPLTLVASALYVLACINLVMDTMRSRQTAAKIAMRKRFAAARRWFARELRSPQPRLRDEWFPYVIGFGLGRNADRWFARFGTAGAATSSYSGSSSTSSMSSSGLSSTGWTGGGGGRFGGAGATGGWALAAGALAAGVSSPSSSSGGGSSSSSSSSSSGGGGGGGW